MPKIKDGYKLELQTPERMQSFGSTEKVIDKTTNKEMYQDLKRLKLF